MNNLVFSPRALAVEIYGSAPYGPAALHTDAAGRPFLSLDATQTIAASTLDIRNLSGPTDSVSIMAADFAIRALDGSQDSVAAARNKYYVTSNTVTLVLGGTVVLSADTSPYARSAFLVRANAISLLTTVYLQLAPVNTPDYFETVSWESGLLLGGKYLLVPAVPLRYARIYATGVGSVLTAYYIGQV